MSHQKFARDVGLIGISQAFTHLGSFLLLPIITKTLGSYDYGIWAQINVTIFLMTHFAVLGLSSGLIRFLSAEKNEKTIQEGFYSIFIFVFLSGLLTSIILYATSDIVASSVFGDPQTEYYIKLASFLILLSAIDQISLFYFRVFRQINFFSYFTMFQNIGKLFLAWILLWQGFGIFGVIVAYLSIHLLVFIGAFLKISSQIGIIIPRFTYIKEYLNYSIPLVPNRLIRWITDSSDRYLVTYFLGLGSVGIYSASYSIGWLIQVLVTPLQLILFPELSKLYDEGKKDQVKIYLSYSLKYFLMLAIPAVFGLSALAQPVLRILTTEEFVAGSTVVSIVALSGLMGGVFQIVINITHLIKKTKLNLYIHFIAAISNILLNILFIPYMGIEGAALSTLISYSIMIIIAAIFSRKYIWFYIDYTSILKMIFSAFLMYGCLLVATPSNLLELLVSIILGAIFYFMLLIVTKTFSIKEISVIKNNR